MKRLIFICLAALLLLPSVAGADDMAKKLNAVLLKAKEEGHWQVKAAEVAQWIKEGKKDFIVVDVRPNGEEFKKGHMPGAIYISYNEILKPENLKKLPRNKKIILVCVTGQTQNLPVLSLRALGYDARTMSFGHTAWIKGYYGGQIMRGAMKGAAENNYPLEK
jgi:rhodanese-related sulfurtransferase